MHNDLTVSHKQLRHIRTKLGAHFKEVQDFEFTIERSKHSMLQTSHGMMNNAGTVRSSVEMDNEGLTTMEQYVLRDMNDIIDQLCH